MTRYMWHLSCNMWHVTHDIWHMVEGEYCLQISGRWLERFWSNDFLKIVRQSINKFLKIKSWQRCLQNIAALFNIVIIMVAVLLYAQLKWF